MDKAILCVVWAGLMFLPHCLAQNGGFHFCSRIISVRNGAKLGRQSDLGFKEGDPVGCIHQREPKDIKSGVFVSSQSSHTTAGYIASRVRFNVNTWQFFAPE